MKERAVYVWTGQSWEERPWGKPAFKSDDIYAVIRVYPTIIDLTKTEVTFSLHHYNADRRTDEDIHGNFDCITTSSYGRTPEQHERFMYMCKMAADIVTTLRKQHEEGKEPSL